jgi:hypothetical protein
VWVNIQAHTRPDDRLNSKYLGTAVLPPGFSHDDPTRNIFLAEPCYWIDDIFLTQPMKDIFRTLEDAHTQPRALNRLDLVSMRAMRKKHPQCEPPFINALIGFMHNFEVSTKKLYHCELIVFFVSSKRQSNLTFNSGLLTA